MHQDTPTSHWRIDNLAVNVMPMLDKTPGFSNRWYPLAAAAMAPTALPDGIVIRLVQAPVFLTNKLEAFADRGNKACRVSAWRRDQPPLSGGAFNSSYTVRATGNNSSRVTSPESA